MDQKLLNLMNTQVEKEMYSANLYLAMASWASREGYPGAAHWLYLQYEEETAHAIHLWEYVMSRGETAVISAIDQPPAEWKSLEDVFANVKSHEKLVTSLIDAIATAAMDVRDHAAYQFISWYVNEQVEEEEHAGEWHAKLVRAAGQPSALLALDDQMAARVFVAPFPTQGL